MVCVTEPSRKRSSGSWCYKRGRGGTFGFRYTFGYTNHIYRAFFHVFSGIELLCSSPAPAPFDCFRTSPDVYGNPLGRHFQPALLCAPSMGAHNKPRSVAGRSLFGFWLDVDHVDQATDRVERYASAVGGLSE